MNQISKELKNQINDKVYVALSSVDQKSLDVANIKYRSKIIKISKMRKELDSEIALFSKELKSQNLRLSSYDEETSKIESRSFDSGLQRDIVNRVIISLQYSKDPEFLGSIDLLIPTIVNDVTGRNRLLRVEENQD